MKTGTSPIVMAEVCQIEEFAGVATEFFTNVLDLDYGDCFVSDDSRLCDFASCGMPDSLSANESDLQSIYAAWDAWIIPEVAQRYGVEISTTTISMVDLFNRISLAKSALAH